MSDSLFSSFAKAANDLNDGYNTYINPLVSKVPYADEIIKASFFASSPILSVGSHLYQMTQTGVSLGSMSAALVDTTVRGYVLPFATRTGTEMISNITGLNAELLDIPAQIGTQALYAKLNYYLINRVVDNDNNTALIIAAWKDDNNKVKALIQAGAKLDLPNNLGETALILAEKLGHTDVMNVLIAAGANVNVKINTDGDTLLIKAAKEGNLDKINLFIHAGAKLDIQNKYSETALICATEKGETDIVKALIKAGVKLDLKNHCDCTALICAAEKGETDIVEALIKAGAKLDLQDNFDCTALSCAAEKGETDIVKAFIQAGAKLDLQEKYGLTALIFAACRGYTEIVNILIQANANLDLQDINFNTALIRAVQNYHTDTVKTLIQGGANINLMNNRGDTALTIAHRLRNNGILFLILRRMSPQQIATALQNNPELKEAVNQFREKENEVAINSAALEKNDYLIFPARMCLKWQAAKVVAKKYTDQDLVNQEIHEDMTKIVEASRKYVPL